MEKCNILTQEFKNKKVQWRLTKKGEKRAVANDISKFLRTGIQIPLGLWMDFDDWEKCPDEPKVEKGVEQGKQVEGDHCEDGDYLSELEKAATKGFFSALNKETVER